MSEIQKAIGNVFVPGKLVDVTPALNVVQNKWGLINALGLFKPEYKSQKLVQINRTHEDVALLEDRNWDERKPTQKGIDRDYTIVAIPHFPIQDAVLPNDVDGNEDLDAMFRGERGVPLSVQKVLAEKMQAARQKAALTLEFARMMMLKDGTAYAPNGTIVTNFYQEFGVTRQTINLDLASTTSNPLGKLSDVYAQVQQSVQTGQIVTDIICICSHEFFNALVTSPFTYEAYANYLRPQGPEILSGRLNPALGLDRRYRSFEAGGILFIESLGGVGGVPYVDPGKAYIFPRGTDAFRTFFAPANKFAYVNKPAQEVYMFTSTGEKDDKIELELETNFLNALVRPEIVFTLDMAA